MPFLYLPDAVSLALILILLVLLRQSFVGHLQQELVRIRQEALVYWSSTGLPQDEPALLSLEHLLDSSQRLAPKASPVRLYFVSRRFRALSGSSGETIADPLSELSLRIERIVEPKVRKRMQHFRLEMLLSVGVYVLMGSLAGWLLLLFLLFRVLVRLFRHGSGDRVDWAMEFMEKLTCRVGRRTQRLVLLTEEN